MSDEISEAQEKRLRQILGIIDQSGGGGMTIKEIATAAKLAGRTPYLTDLLSRLEAAGWVRREMQMVTTETGKLRRAWKYYPVPDPR